MIDNYDDQKEIKIQQNKVYEVKKRFNKSPDRYDVESIPSEISDDMWGELPRFKDYQHQ